jgi:transcriptional regulator with XRE-family HTH domain
MISRLSSSEGAVESKDEEDEDGTAVGRVLRRARTRRQWSVREVARRTGFGNTYLSQVERGVIRKPDPTALWQLASLYNLDFGLLLEWSGQAGRDRQVFFDAMKAFTALEPDEQAEALEYLRSLSGRRRA